MIEKTASVHWEGRGKKGLGQISTETDTLKHYPYGFGSRFEDDRRGTNPEELLGAAHAACFTMAFSFACDAAGFATGTVDTQAKVSLAKEGDGFVIDRITLTMQAQMDGIDEATFQDIANTAKKACPVSKALTGVAEIRLIATLNGQGKSSDEAPASAPASTSTPAPARAPAGEVKGPATGPKTNFSFEVQYLATSGATQDKQDSTMKLLDTVLQQQLAAHDSAVRVTVSDSHKGSSNKLVEVTSTMSDAQLGQVLEAFSQQHGVSVTALE